MSRFESDPMVGSSPAEILLSKLNWVYDQDSELVYGSDPARWLVESTEHACALLRGSSAPDSELISVIHRGLEDKSHSLIHSVGNNSDLYPMSPDEPGYGFYDAVHVLRAIAADLADPGATRRRVLPGC